MSEQRTLLTVFRANRRVAGQSNKNGRLSDLFVLHKLYFYSIPLETGHGLTRHKLDLRNFLAYFFRSPAIFLVIKAEISCSALRSSSSGFIYVLLFHTQPFINHRLPSMMALKNLP